MPREDSWVHLVLIRPSGKQMSAVSKRGLGGGGLREEERRDGAWIGLGGYAVYRALSPPPFTLPPPKLSTSFSPSSHHFILPLLLPSQADFRNSFLPPGKERKERSWQQRRECSPLSLALFLSLSFLLTSLIPRWVPSFITAYHVCIILYRTLPINIIRAARST